MNPDYHERRRERRISVSHYNVKVADTRFYYCANIIDLSRHGIMLGGIASQFDTRVQLAPCLLHVPGKVFVNVDLIPTWSSENKADPEMVNMGFSIHSPPALWQEFVAHLASTGKLR